VWPVLALFLATDIVAVDDFIDAPRALFGRTRAAVERTLGVPVSIRERALPAGANFTAEAADELTYPGVVIAVSRRSSTVRRVQMSEPRWPLPRGLTIDTTRARVEAALGEPQLVADTSVVYLDADGFPNTVEFQFRDGRVRRIEWSYAAVD
jgi:hypothetical protein